MPVAPPVMTATLFLKSVNGRAVIVVDAAPFVVGVCGGDVLDQCCGKADAMVGFGLVVFERLGTCFYTFAIDQVAGRRSS